MLRKWDDLPGFMRTPEVRPYWEILWQRRGQLVVKRCFDVVMGILLLIVLFFPMVIISVLIKLDSRGPIMYRQERVTSYGKHFRIHKFHASSFFAH